ncbi:MAG TPA: hypothetical protein ENN28_01880 [Candidatus Uhrbacteria bacterium]|nr:hypothetical protein [Candidatus Uhrbacteria bacterium]
MPSQQTKIKPLPLTKTFSNSFQIAQKSWPEMVLIIFIVISIIIAVQFLLPLIYFLLFKYNLIKEEFFYTFHLIWRIISYIIYLIIAVIAQILMLNQLIKPQINLKENFNAIKKFFISFLGLTISVNILFLIFSLPIQVGVFLFLFDQLVLGFIALILGIALTLLLATAIIFSPFLLIEKKISCPSALKLSFDLSRRNFPNLLLKLIVIALLFIIINGFATIFFSIPYAGFILGSATFLLMIIFAFTTLYAIYREFNV